MSDTADLMQDVYAHFRNACGQGSSAGGDSLLVFESAGFEPGLTTNQPNSGSLAVEMISAQADILPDLASGTYQRTLQTISTLYAEVLNAAEPTDDAAVASFNALKASAREAFDNASLGSTLAASRFQPAFATPANWYDPAQADNWTSYAWNGNSVQNGIGSSASPVSAPLQFEYCVVQLRRSWFSGTLLSTPGWCVPGKHKGDFSSGPLATPAPGSVAPPGSSTPLQTGPLAYVPIAFIAVKNLSISAAAFGLGNSTVQGATAVGPFSVSASSSGSQALTHPGIQIIGWMCAVQPQLPPATDPVLIVTKAEIAGNVLNDVGTMAGALSGLFWKKKGVSDAGH